MKNCPIPVLDAFWALLHGRNFEHSDQAAAHAFVEFQYMRGHNGQAQISGKNTLPAH